MRGSFYSSKGRFPPSTNMGIWITAFWRIKTSFPPNLSLVHCHVGSAKPCCPPLATAFCWVSAWWVLMSDRSVPGLDWSVWSGLWALFVGMTQCQIFCASMLRLSSVLLYSGYGCLQSKNHQNLWKWLAIIPITTFGGLNVKKKCRS